MIKALFRQETLVFLGIGLVSILISGLITFLILDYWKGETIEFSGRCIDHHYVPSRTEPRTRIVKYGKSTHVEFYTVHYSEKFILTVACPEGPKDIEVRHNLYAHYQDGKPVPVRRIIGYYSKSYLATWIE
ncbi:hypothetical protein [Siphonobacter sp. SORGH_AS_1065]|uniref:hypothetical protein n=1 Tax=Siphonobacter sp. SORGH_AS_1065 TaxID=3041795 RepID=UPI0027885645|nr:hypothetical protein [Siphonobacter sp. SORGH_AS_1065]MDQ1085654.1 hypothetical protein [Siphonobacter sp. SORGH_AS_1065]